MTALSLPAEVVSTRLTVLAVDDREAALSRLIVTRIVRAGIVVVTYGLVHAGILSLKLWVARVVGANVAVIAGLRILFFAPCCRIARVGCTGVIKNTVPVEVVAVDRGVLACPGVLVTGVKCARIAIVTVRRRVDALTFHARVGCALVYVVTVHRREPTASGQWVTGTQLAKVSSDTFLLLVQTADFRLACLRGAWITVVRAVDRQNGAITRLWVAYVLRAQVAVITGSVSVGTNPDKFTLLTDVYGTRLPVVTIRGCLAGYDTVRIVRVDDVLASTVRSLLAKVDGTGVLIVARVRVKVTSVTLDYRVAIVHRALVAVIAQSVILFRVGTCERFRIATVHGARVCIITEHANIVCALNIAVVSNTARVVRTRIAIVTGGTLLAESRLRAAFGNDACLVRLTLDRFMHASVCHKVT